MQKLAVIGLGKQNTKDHIPAILKNDNATIVAVCDTQESVAKQWGEELHVPYFTDVQDLVDKVTFKAAVVAVPHDAYLPIIRVLAEHRINIFKEKPLAVSIDEATEIVRLAEDNDINLTVAVQRKHNKIFQTYLDYVGKIGDVFSIHGHYTLNIDRLDSGWRSSKQHAGGGAVIDMGYHLIDLLLWYCGVPERISAELGYGNRREQSYDVEDTVKVQFSYPMPRGRRILGSLLLSRIYPTKEEQLSIYGTSGSIHILKDRIELLDADREVVESVYIRPDGTDVLTQLNQFIERLDTHQRGNYREHLQHMVFIDAIYRSATEGETMHPLTDPRYTQLLAQEPVKNSRKPSQIKRKTRI